MKGTIDPVYHNILHGLSSKESVLSYYDYESATNPSYYMQSEYTNGYEQYPSQSYYQTNEDAYPMYEQSPEYVPEGEVEYL